MKIPKTPPDYFTVFKGLSGKEQFERIFTASSTHPGPNGKYRHWDELKRLQPPDGLSHEEWWFRIKTARRAGYKFLPLRDKSNQPFCYTNTDPIPERLQRIDLGVGGIIKMPAQIKNPDTRDQYYISSLIEEAITSSQLEGATTTRMVAKQMIRAGRKPSDRSEQMIFNNYRAMRRISNVKDRSLSLALICELHRLVTEDTLDDRTAAGRIRRSDEQVVVNDDQGTVFHRPPPADELTDRLSALCEFANEQTPEYFVHPVLRSIILHFWLAYDHPFVDGNGRTARALFYWSMLHYGYWLSEFISISEIILKGPSKYNRAFLFTETDDNDLTYFVIYHLEIIRRAVDKLHVYIERKTKDLQAVEGKLRALASFNHRQRAFLSHALRHPGRLYTIESHRVSHGVAHQTARSDLLELKARNLLSGNKNGKTWYFEAPKDLEDKLEQLR